MRRIWNWMVLSRIIQITEGTAKDSADVDTSLAAYSGQPLAVAQIVRFAMRPYRVTFPDADVTLLAAARQYGAAAPANSPRLPGTILVMADGALALALDQVRTIESYGLGLCIVAAPAAGRYVEAWEIPGVIYWGGR